MVRRNTNDRTRSGQGTPRRTSSRRTAPRYRERYDADRYEDVEDRWAGEEYLDDDYEDYEDYTEPRYSRQLREENVSSRNARSGRSTQSSRSGQSSRRSRNQESQSRSSQSRSSRTGKRRKKKHPFLKIVLFLVLAIVICNVAWSFISPYLGERYWTIAVFGVDSRDGNLDAGALSDVIMVASVDKRSGDVKLCSVYRDTYSRIDRDNNYHKINEAYFKGGHTQAIQALEDNLDLKIDDYITFNWSAVAKAITALGGVDLEISDAEFYYINAFITETVNSTGLGSVQLEHAGMNHLDGVQAVAYGRLRLMDTDFNRTARQRKILSLTMDKAKTASAKTLVNVASYVFPEVSTSMGLSDVTTIARNVRKYNLAETSGFPFARTTKKIRKMDCVIPATLSSNVAELHKFLYAEEDYQPSETVKSISAHISEVSGVYDPAENAEEATVGGGSVGKTASKDTAKKTETAAQAAETAESSTAESTEESTEETTEESTEESTEEKETETVEEPGKMDSGEDRNETIESTAAVETPAPKGPGDAGDDADAAHGPGME